MIPEEPKDWEKLPDTIATELLRYIYPLNDKQIDEVYKIINKHLSLARQEEREEAEIVGRQQVAEEITEWINQTSGISESSRYLLEAIIERLKQYIP